MRTKRVSVTVAAVLAASLHFAAAQPIVSKGVLLTQTGHSLYTFDNDVVGSGTSVCNPPCSNIFPPYLGADKDSGQGDFALISRQDGSKQWTYKGRPLYRFYADDKPGDQGGDGTNRNLWHVARH
jgi:predicted lipoprotein with Yx(FWY)xxD motif